MVFLVSNLRFNGIDYFTIIVLRFSDFGDEDLGVKSVLLHKISRFI